MKAPQDEKWKLKLQREPNICNTQKNKEVIIRV